MGTRSTIAMKKPDGGLVATYCHWDGYPDHNGKILNENYQDDEKIQQLIGLGDISSLRPEIGEKHRFPADHEVCKTAAWRQLYDSWTTAYHRDRGEPWDHVAPQHFDDAKEWVESMSESWVEWAYLWNGQDWLVHKIRERGESKGYPVFDFAEIAIEKDAELAN